MLRKKTDKEGQTGGTGVGGKQRKKMQGASHSNPSPLCPCPSPSLGRFHQGSAVGDHGATGHLGYSKEPGYALRSGETHTGVPPTPHYSDSKRKGIAGSCENSDLGEPGMGPVIWRF